MADAENITISDLKLSLQLAVTRPPHTTMMLCSEDWAIECMCLVPTLVVVKVTMGVDTYSQENNENYHNNRVLK